jgi:GT2 family glycosyltransferase
MRVEPSVRRDVIFIQTGANLGYGGGNNVGMQFAIERLGARFVWILNNDTVVQPGALSALLDFAAAREDVAVIGSRLMNYYEPECIQALGGGSFTPAFAHDVQFGRGSRADTRANESFDLHHIVGASMFVRVRAVRQVGMLDESYFLYREETDWCIRMRNAGWRLAYCPTSVVHHKEGRSAGFKSLLHDYYSVRNMLYLIQRFYPLSLATAFAASAVRALGPKLVRLELRRAAIVARAYADFFRGICGKQLNPEELMAVDAPSAPALQEASLPQPIRSAG